MKWNTLVIRKGLWSLITLKGRSGTSGRRMENTWRTLHNEDIHNLYCMRWLENLKGRVHLEDLDVDGKIILERILGK
jgi:hypothetical protein